MKWREMTGALSYPKDYSSESSLLSDLNVTKSFYSTSDVILYCCTLVTEL